MINGPTGMSDRLQVTMVSGTDEDEWVTITKSVNACSQKSIKLK